MRRVILISSALAVTFLVPGNTSASTALTKTVSVDEARVSAAQSRPFTLVAGTRKFTASATEVRKWFKSWNADGGRVMQLRPGAIYNYLNVYVSPRVNQPGKSSRFERIDGNLHLIGPGTKGKIVDGVKTSLAIRSAIVAGKSSATVHMKQHRPSVFSASDFTKLEPQFTNVLARGESNFAGSPANRRHNIHVATQKYNGLVIMPNEEFSFNQYLGNVDAANGYLPELVIKEGVTTPEYGGGICQVSTTAFRGALESGMRITSRRNHSYPVAYYGTPGYDATVYAPYTDMKWVNDTGKPVYIRTKILGTRVIFEMRGQGDGRQVRINGPFVTGTGPDGSSTAAIAQFVTRGGKTVREQNFVSKYKSPDDFPIIRDANGG